MLSFLAILQLYLRKRRLLPDATSPTIGTSTTSATSTTIATSTTSTTSTTTTPPPECKRVYTFYPGPGRRFCFFIKTDCRSWNEARLDCQAEDADLAVLDDISLLPFSEIMREQFPAGDNCDTATAAWLGAMTCYACSHIFRRREYSIR
ncbi:hypothetical protein CHS0354_039969 [Potamilus streckersoni]|uniref:C-type lectin domain-containing protein n=1 Tax=Potamilus streckersoni TaxID=2493646 RepID=A0AAE0W6I3_9BIVA|nr:hypothetical protein CHS0354_039969 [Potamilus streckersoni]